MLYYSRKIKKLKGQNSPKVLTIELLSRYYSV